MFVCPEPKTSQVMMKWCRRASHLGRFTLWHNAAELHNSVDLLYVTQQLPSYTTWQRYFVVQWLLSYYTTRQIYFVQHNSCRATRLGRFTRYTLWHDGRQATTQLDRFTLCGTTASELHNSVDLLCGTTATKLHISVDLLCGTMAAELHNLVELLCTTATELNNPLSLTHAPGVTHIFQRQ